MKNKRNNMKDKIKNIKNKIKNIKNKIKKADPGRPRQRTTLSQLIKDNKDLGDAKIFYCNRKNGPILATGKITPAGVLCCCCQNLFTLTKFEVHAGSTNRRPAANIFLENGVSLQDCQDQMKRKKNGFNQTVKLSEKHSTGVKPSGELGTDGTDVKASKECGTDVKPSKERGTDEKLSETTKVTSGKSTVMLCDAVSHHGSNHDEPSDKSDSDGYIALQTFKNDQESCTSCDFNDDECSICCQNGDLLMCDQCPASFHVSCLGLTMAPTCRLWYCPYCCCRICGQICIVTKGKTPESCTYVYERVVRCEQCLKPHHTLCVNGDGYVEDKWFCTAGCENIFYGLQGVLYNKMKVEGHDNLTWTLLQNRDGIDPINLKKLKSALDVIHECFNPSEEYRTKKDIHEILVLNKGAELNLDDLRGFYTVILEKCEEITTVATVRVHGVEVAEIPLVATRFKDRKQGHCRLLIDSIEKVFIEFGVARLVLPAADREHTLTIWNKHFGFHPMTEFERFNLLGFHLLNFTGTIMCQKNLRYNVVY